MALKKKKAITAKTAKKPKKVAESKKSLSNITVLGEVLTQQDVADRVPLVPAFTRDQMKASRRVLDTLAALTTPDIDRRILYALQDGVNLKQRAKAAWEALGWHLLLNPYMHASREHYLNGEPLKKWIFKDAGALFMFGVFIIREPNKEIAEALKTLHPGTYQQYKDHCRMLAVAAATMQAQFSEAETNTSVNPSALVGRM